MTTATVIDTTTYTKHAVTNAQAIQQGKCLAAQGTLNAGVLQAATIDLEPCPPMGGGHHRFHLPGLPHLPALPPPRLTPTRRRINTIGAAQGCAAQRD